MFGHELSGNFLIGFLIVLISMHQVRLQGRVGRHQGGEGIGGVGNARVSERSDGITGGAGAFGGCLQIRRDGHLSRPLGVCLLVGNTFVGPCPRY